MSSLTSEACRVDLDQCKESTNSKNKEAQAIRKYREKQFLGWQLLIFNGLFIPIAFVWIKKLLCRLYILWDDTTRCTLRTFSTLFSYGFVLPQIVTSSVDLYWETTGLLMQQSTFLCRSPFSKWSYKKQLAIWTLLFVMLLPVHAMVYLSVMMTIFLLCRKIFMLCTMKFTFDNANV